MHLRWLLPAYLVVIAIGYLSLTAPGSTVRGNELSPTAAVFATVNAVTLTGFPTATPLAQYTTQGQLVVLALTIFGTLFVLIVGGVAGCRALGLRHPRGRIIVFSVIVYVLAVAYGTVAMAAGSEMSLYDALFAACSAFGNAGLHLALPAAERPVVHLGLLPLTVVGGLGMPVLINVVDRLLGVQRTLTSHARVALVGSAVMYVGGIGLLLLTTWAAGASMSPAPAVVASALSIDARTGGFGLVTPDQLPRATQWVVLLLMAVGGVAAGTAGGIKLTTLAALLGGARVSRDGHQNPVTLAFAIVAVSAYVGLVVLTMLVLLTTEPQIPADRLLFEVVSAASNVGLSFGPVSLVGPGMYMLCLTMLLGRLLPLVILVRLARSTESAGVLVG